MILFLYLCGGSVEVDYIVGWMIVLGVLVFVEGFMIGFYGCGEKLRYLGGLVLKRGVR